MQHCVAHVYYRSSQHCVTCVRSSLVLGFFFPKSETLKKMEASSCLSGSLSERNWTFGPLGMGSGGIVVLSRVGLSYSCDEVHGRCPTEGSE